MGKDAADEGVMTVRFIVLLLAAVLITGCAAEPAMRPVDARGRLMADPRVAGWFDSHSAPTVLAGLSPREAKRWRKYQPAVMFDRVTEGYRVTLDARFGPAPRSLEALMDPQTGAILSLRER